MANYRFLCRHEDDAEYCGQSIMKTNRGNSCCFSYEILLTLLPPPSLLLPPSSNNPPSTQPQVAAELKTSLQNSYLLRSQCFFARVCPSLSTTLCVGVSSSMCVCVFLLSPAMLHAHTQVCKLSALSVRQLTKHKYCTNISRGCSRDWQAGRSSLYCSYCARVCELRIGQLM